MPRNPWRQGSTLIIVAGLASLLLLISVTFLARIRTDAEESALVVRDTQARIMLVAALQYIQETSRLGWRNASMNPDAIGGGDGGYGYETYGWTDVRDGSIGPRGPRPAGASQPLPVPTWWKSGPYPHDTDGDPHNPYVAASLPSAGNRRWPCPGSAMRGDMYVMERTPYAVRLTIAPNPMVADPTHDPSPVINFPYNTSAGETGRGLHRSMYMIMGRSMWDNYYAKAGPDIGDGVGKGVGKLDPQPLADTWTDFKTGDPTPRASSTDLSWFRIYREMPADHDNDGAPWFDRVPLQGYSTFIIACGAGATRGYRFWNTTDAGFSRDLEPETAEESGLFVDEAMFKEMRAHERILWYRAEWTAMQGGGGNSIGDRLDTSGYGGGASDQSHNPVNTMNGIRFTGNENGNPEDYKQLPASSEIVSFFGAIKWIQRLEKDPITW